MPEVELIVEIAPDGATSAEFNHPFAINRAAEKASGDVFIVADADTAFDPEWVREAASMAASWVLPRFYDQVTEKDSDRILSLDPSDPIPSYETDWQGDSVSWSGLVVVPREGFETVGGYDERWRFWGGDDVAFTCALKTLWGPVTRLEGSAIHLWHPRTHLDAQPQDQHDLMHRYLRAEGHPKAMRQLLGERDQ